MKYFTAILYSRDGCEIDRCSDCEGIAHAKERARYMLSDKFAEMNETTHQSLQTMKAAVFNDGADTGAGLVCEWDREHSQHASWLAEQERNAQQAESDGETKANGETKS